MVNVLPQLVDVDEFIRFWAVETLLGAWDSATGNANNFHIYRDPETACSILFPGALIRPFEGRIPSSP